MELLGDGAGIAALKALKDKNKDYLKFLIGEARSNTDFTASFTAEDGATYVLQLDPKSGNITVTKKS